MTDTKRERMFQAELLHQQLEQIEQFLDRLDRQAAELSSLKEAMTRFAQLQDGQRMLVPLAAGIFAPATSTTDKQLLVNVGQNVVVPKTPAEVQELLDAQLRELRTYERDLHAQFDAALAKLSEIEREFKT